MTVRSLGEMVPGEKGIIIRVGGRGGIRRRLLDMGVVAGAELEVQRVAPLGDPVEIRIKGYELALRKREAAAIDVDVAYLKSEMMSLSMASSGETVRVATFKGGWGLRRRLADMGLTPGVIIKVVSSSGHGQVVIDIRGSRLALGHGVAHKVMVVAGGSADE